MKGHSPIVIWIFQSDALSIPHFLDERQCQVLVKRVLTKETRMKNRGFNKSQEWVALYEILI